MPMTAVALKPCASGSFRGAVIRAGAGLAPATAPVTGAFPGHAGGPVPVLLTVPDLPR